MWSYVTVKIFEWEQSYKQIRAIENFKTGQHDPIGNCSRNFSKCAQK